MTHFGVMCPELRGHLNPMMALARELQRRGHQVTFYQRPAGRPIVEAAGFLCRIFGETLFPPDVTLALARRLAAARGYKALIYPLDMIKRWVTASLGEVPQLMRTDGVQIVLMDETVSTGLTIAELLGLPTVSVCTGLSMAGELEVPPFCTSWRYQTYKWALLRNRVAYRLLARLAQPMGRVLNEHRQQLGLPPTGTSSPFGSPRAKIFQQPLEFDFPRRNRPDTFHFTGPLTDHTLREPIDFPFEQLDGRPLVYASLGTVVGRKQQAFTRIAHACAALDVQLVISLGGDGTPQELANLPGSPLVVKFAPQLQLLQRAALCITHAGMNTTLEALSEGVPLVALPVINDQLGIAARIAWTGCGEFLSPRRQSAKEVRGLVGKVLAQRHYREAAGNMREAIRRAGGVPRAAEIVEHIS